MGLYEILNAKAAVEKVLETSGEVLSSGTSESTPQLALEPMLEPVPTIPPNIPADAVEFNGHYCYLYKNANGVIANTWEDALAYCQNLGG